MLRSCKTEIKLTKEQQNKVNRAIGVCRYVYNLYIRHNQQVYEQEKKFVSAADFSKWLNNEYLVQNPEHSWIKEVSSKSVKQSIRNCETAFKKFFKGLSSFPKFKRKRNNTVKMYFVKNDARTIIQCERHRIKIPTLGWVRLKEKGYLPSHSDNCVIKSGHVSRIADKYFVSITFDTNISKNKELKLDASGIGIDLGIKSLATVSNGDVYININKEHKIRKLEKKLKRENKKLSRKWESYKKLSEKEKGEATRRNIYKQTVKVQRIYYRLYNLRTNHINQVVNSLVKTKPGYITIEDLNVKGMMRNRHLAKAVQDQKFAEFRTKLTSICHDAKIELRLVNRFFPSSKQCSRCGNIKHDLKLSDRIYKCDKCNLEIDRDLNASINLRDAKDYIVVV